jgi:regulator of replication initiation timing
MVRRDRLDDDDPSDAGVVTLAGDDDTDHPVDAADTGGAAPEASGSSRRRLRAFVAVLAVVGLLGGGAIAWLIVERNDLRERNAALSESLDIARGDAGEQIEQLEAANAALAQQVAELEQALADSRQELDDLRVENEELSTELAAVGEELVVSQEAVTELQATIDAVGELITPMPDLVGSTLAEVEAFADEIEAELVVELARPPGVISPPDAVIEQRPAEDVTLVPGSVIWVQVYAAAEE